MNCLVVIDTNVWISGLFWGGSTSKVIDLLEKEEVTACFSPETLKEWDDKVKLYGQKFTRIEVYFKYRNHIQKYGRFVYPIEKVTACHDEDDNRILEVAVASKAEFIITGDDDLLTLKKYKSIKIISPKEFLRNFPQ